MELAHKALAGLGTNETLLMELILGRPSNEIKLLIEGYRIRYKKDLVSEVMSDLSGKIERSSFFLFSPIATDDLTKFFILVLVVFVMALNAQRPPDHIPVDYSKVGVDIETLYQASKKKEEVCYFIIVICCSCNSFFTWFFRFRFSKF